KSIAQRNKPWSDLRPKERVNVEVGGHHRRRDHASNPLARSCPSNHSLTLVDWNVAHVARPDVFRAWADEFVVGILFEDVTGPAADAADGEDRSVKIQRNAHHVVSRG